MAASEEGRDRAAMADGVTMLVGVSALVLALVLLGGAAQMYADAGLRVFVWPRVEHTYELDHATRLAALPWYMLAFLLAVNGLCVLLFGHDVLKQPASGAAFWFIALLLPVLMAHLLDYRRSRLVAILTLLAVGGTVAGVVHLTGSWVPVALAVPLLLWSVNGVRATFADRALFG